LMSEVYGNSTLNIAATHAKDGNGGLFIMRDTSFMSARYLIESRGGKLYDLRDNKLYDRCINDAPLASRAWTIQERFLAPRTIHFTSEQMFYECNQLLACETWPEGLPNRDEDDLGRNYLSVTDTAKFPKAVDDEGWVRIIDQYSKAQLTFGKDKLTAFSGITRLFGDRTGNEYFAGLCRKNLERQLCWSRNVYISNADRGWNSIGNAYRAPSWSWASIDEPVRWYSYTSLNILDIEKSDPLIQVINVTVYPAGKDPLGELVGAHLKLRCGPILRSAIVKGKWSSWVNKNRLWSSSVDFNPSLRIDHSTSEGGLILDKQEDEGTITERIESKRDISFLPLLQSLRDERVYLYGLILEPALDHRGYGKGVFRRIGLFEFIICGESYKAIDDALFRRNYFHLAENTYQEILGPDGEGKKQYVVRVV
jgi:hypothetical protein